MNSSQKNDTAYIKLMRLNRRLDSLAEDASTREPVHKKVFSQKMNPNLLRGSKKYIFCRIEEDDYKQLQKRVSEDKSLRQSCEKIESKRLAAKESKHESASNSKCPADQPTTPHKNKKDKRLRQSIDIKVEKRGLKTEAEANREYSETVKKASTLEASQLKPDPTAKPAPNQGESSLRKNHSGVAVAKYSVPRSHHLSSKKPVNSFLAQTNNNITVNVFRAASALKNSETQVDLSRRRLLDEQKLAGKHLDISHAALEKRAAEQLLSGKDSLTEESRTEKKSFLEGLINKKFSDMQNSAKYRMENLRHFESHRLQSFHQRKHNLLKLNKALNCRSISKFREEEVRALAVPKVVSTSPPIPSPQKPTGVSKKTPKHADVFRNIPLGDIRAQTMPTERNEKPPIVEDKEEIKGLKIAAEKPKLRHQSPGHTKKPAKEKPTIKSAAMIGNITKMISFLDSDKELKDQKLTYRQKILQFHRDYGGDPSEIESHCNEDHGNLRHYRVCKTLGEGASATVQLVLDTRTNQKYAMKVYTKKSYYDTMKDHIVNEALLLEKCSHPSIIKLVEWFEGHRKIYLVEEYVGSTTLSEYLESKKAESGALDEDEACHIFYEIAQGLLYLHSKGIYHRDVKIHNVIVGLNSEVKLIDLGYAVELLEAQPISTFCGTPSYMPPEVIARKPYFPEKADVWSFGVCLFRVLCGRMPFTGVSQTNLFYHIKRGEYQCAPGISNPAKSLLGALLDPLPERRPSIKDMLKHPWFVAITPESTADLG